VTHPARDRRSSERGAEPSADQSGPDPMATSADSAWSEDGESRYRPAAPGQPGPSPKVRIELVVVDGPDGRQLRARQAAAIRRALRWFVEHQTETTTGPP
jgi:hypothetical protein